MVLVLKIQYQLPTEFHSVIVSFSKNITFESHFTFRFSCDKLVFNGFDIKNPIEDAQSTWDRTYVLLLVHSADPADRRCDRRMDRQIDMIKVLWAL